MKFIPLNGHWDFPEQMGLKPKVGFIYVIKDLYMDKFYLGKKLYYGTGVKNKGKETNWKKYVSSSPLLKEMLAERPMSEFKFFCLEEYSSKGGLAYAETWSLCLVEAPTTGKWYNKRIEAISWNVKEPVSLRHKERLAQILEG